MKKLFILLAVFAFMITMSFNVMATVQAEKTSKDVVTVSQMTGILIEENVVVTANEVVAAANDQAIVSMAAEVQSTFQKNTVSNTLATTQVNTNNTVAAILKCPMTASAKTANLFYG